jgi:hypothetical protein
VGPVRKLRQGFGCVFRCHRPRRAANRGRGAQGVRRDRGDASQFRDALVAIDVAGLSYSEAAKALRLREQTITSRM